MKVTAFNGSARKDGNTAIMIRWVFSELEKAGIETEMVQLAGRRLDGCYACYKCMERKNNRCAVETDDLNGHIAKILESDGIILASPVYFADLTPSIKALIDRAGMVARANRGIYSRKVGAALSVARRGGTVHTFDSLNHFFLINEMIVPGSSYWNIGYGREIGGVENDTEAKEVMTTLGNHMAWLLKKIAD